MLRLSEKRHRLALAVGLAVFYVGTLAYLLQR